MILYLIILSFFFQTFREASFTPYFIPVLHFEYTNGDQLAAALMDSKNYSGKLSTACFHQY